mmetsp:Transcript_14693/g.32301  ORF Transcript_14693/g.32301 Transcript_14693/m.32301 type:complete len:434 (+) Transcript_14693:225-1526(+)
MNNLSITLRRCRLASSRRLSSSSSAKGSGSKAATTNVGRTEISPLSNASSARRDEPVDVGEVAKRLGIRLTQCETELLKTKLDVDKDGKVTCLDFTLASKRSLEDRTIRELCLQVIEQPANRFADYGSSFVKWMNLVGVALFSVAGTQVAGDADFNVIGCTLVGCIAGLGGRTVNNLLYGNSSPLTRGLPGVFWTRDRLSLGVAIASSLVTFIVWPLYTAGMSDHIFHNVIGKSELEDDGSVGEEAFVAACERDADFEQAMRMGIKKKVSAKELDSMSARDLFNYIDLDNSGTICAEEVTTLIQDRVRHGVEMYAIDTLALATNAVTAVHGAISMGIHPLVAATSGITMSLGSIFRDLFCGRDLVVASESYAFATGAGSTVYVITREMALRGIAVIAPIRISLAIATTIGIRYWEYVNGEPLLSPMHAKHAKS